MTTSCRRISTREFSTMMTSSRATILSLSLQPSVRGISAPHLEGGTFHEESSHHSAQSPYTWSHRNTAQTTNVHRSITCRQKSRVPQWRRSLAWRIKSVRATRWAIHSEAASVTYRNSYALARHLRLRCSHMSLTLVRQKNTLLHETSSSVQNYQRLRICPGASCRRRVRRCCAVTGHLLLRPSSVQCGNGRNNKAKALTISKPHARTKIHKTEFHVLTIVVSSLTRSISKWRCSQKHSPEETATMQWLPLAMRTRTRVCARVTLLWVQMWASWRMGIRRCVLTYRWTGYQRRKLRMKTEFKICRIACTRRTMQPQSLPSRDRWPDNQLEEWEDREGTSGLLSTRKISD